LASAQQRGPVTTATAWWAEIFFLTGTGSAAAGFGVPKKPRALLNNVAATAGFLSVCTQG
jgi:hypothetical protein